MYKPMRGATLVYGRIPGRWRTLHVLLSMEGNTIILANAKREHQTNLRDIYKVTTIFSGRYYLPHTQCILLLLLSVAFL